MGLKERTRRGKTCKDSPEDQQNNNQKNKQTKNTLKEKTRKE